MSRLKVIGAGSKYAGKKLTEVLRKIRRSKAAKKYKANQAKIGLSTKSVKRYQKVVGSKTAGDKTSKVIPVKAQSQRGSTFKRHKVRGPQATSRLGYETVSSWRDEMDRMFGDISIDKFFKK